MTAGAREEFSVALVGGPQPLGFQADGIVDEDGLCVAVGVSDRKSQGLEVDVVTAVIRKPPAKPVRPHPVHADLNRHCSPVRVTA